ncbi:hypothetical protein SLA2020_203830 [Shorea laevis]
MFSVGLDPSRSKGPKTSPAQCLYLFPETEIVPFSSMLRVLMTRSNLRPRDPGFAMTIRGCASRIGHASNKTSQISEAMATGPQGRRPPP